MQKKFDAFCSNNQHTDSLYTLLRYRFSGRMVAKSGQLCNNKQRAVRFNHQKRGVDKMPSIVKKTILRKNSKKNCSAPSKRLILRKLVEQSLQIVIEEVKMTEFEIQITMFVDCFLDGHGIYTSKLAPFRIKSL